MHNFALLLSFFPTPSFALIVTTSPVPPSSQVCVCVRFPFFVLANVIGTAGLHLQCGLRRGESRHRPAGQRHARATAPFGGGHGEYM